VLEICLCLLKFCWKSAVHFLPADFFLARVTISSTQLLLTRLLTQCTILQNCHKIDRHHAAKWNYIGVLIAIPAIQHHASSYQAGCLWSQTLQICGKFLPHVLGYVTLTSHILISHHQIVFTSSHMIMTPFVSGLHLILVDCFLYTFSTTFLQTIMLGNCNFVTQVEQHIAF